MIIYAVTIFLICLQNRINNFIWYYSIKYTQKNDTLTTGLARGSDTYSLNFTGGTGTGFRAHVNVVGGSVQIVEVIDKGKGYTAGDVLTLNNAVELG